MKKFFFFQSVDELSSDNIHRLRALPGQTLEDGTPVDTTLNVQAPKTDTTRAGYNKAGIYFASDHLELVANGKGFYTVYPNADPKAKVMFKVLTSPDGSYKVRKHDITDTTEAQFALWLKSQGRLSEPETQAAPSDGGKPAKGPAQRSGLARPVADAFDETYEGQVEAEVKVLVVWMRDLFRSYSVTPAVKTGNTAELQNSYARLLAAGEDTDTIANRDRFLAWLKSKTPETKIEDFAFTAQYPLQGYLSWLEDEHDNERTCTATARNLGSRDDTDEMALTLLTAYNLRHGYTDRVTDADCMNMQKAFQEGWTVPELMRPERLDADTSSFSDLARKLSDGTIPLPEDANGRTLLERIQNDRKYACPTDAEGFHVDSETWENINHHALKRWNTLLVGPTGSGKTQIVEMLAERQGLPLTVIQMGLISDPTEQLVGKMDLDGKGGTVFDWAEFALAIQKPGIILLDEINRMPRNGNNTLLSCLDHRRELAADGAKGTDVRRIKVHPDCVFFATANIGGEYTGTHEIDAALDSRFDRIEMGYMKPQDEIRILMQRCGIEEADATAISNVAQQTRTTSEESGLVPVSTRQTLRCAEMVADGYPVRRALETVLLPLYEDSRTDSECSQRHQVRMIIQGIL